MRILHVGLLAVALSACWWENAKQSTTSGGTGSEGGGGSGTSCATCADVALAGEPESGLCSTSKPLFDSILACACDPGPCSAACYPTVCSGLAADTSCTTCMTSMCASTYAVCSKDQSQ